jgi:predicted nucleic acid-binding protein
MANAPLSRIFLDTNVFIIGAADIQSDEGIILSALGFWQPTSNAFEIIISQELLEQIARVAGRLKHKDWAGELIGRILQNFNIHYVFLEQQELVTSEKNASIPREDVSVYLTAKVGQADYFVSANHKLIRSLVEQTGDFLCLTPQQFIDQVFPELRTN